MSSSNRQDDTKKRAVIIGGGPAGLTAALEFLKLGAVPTVLEKSHRVGGIARTERYNGNYFDMGGHRFFTKSPVVEKLWNEILPDDFLTRPRLSRIFYKKEYFHYPPQLFDTLKGLGVIESIRIVASYTWRHFFPYRNATTFEQWVSNAFGKRLFEIFFKSYTEKVWGLSCSELGADWAKQRIKELSIKTLIQTRILGHKRQITTLIDEFRYPRLGPGMMWETAAEKVEQAGGTVILGSEVIAVERDGWQVKRVITNCGEQIAIDGEYFISSMPVNHLIAKLTPPPPNDVLEAAAALKHRDFLTVCLIVNRPDLFPDNWVYIHEPDVQVARIQNYKNWSPDMVSNLDHSNLGLEYFCNQGDALWNTADSELIELATKELSKIGLITDGQVIDGCVFRVPDAYPVYDSSYQENLDTIRAFCDQLINLRTVGRNGLHRYNNQDHSMLTALYAVRMLVLGEQHELWKINAEQEYLEERIEPQPNAPAD